MAGKPQCDCADAVTPARVSRWACGPPSVMKPEELILHSYRTTPDYVGGYWGFGRFHTGKRDIAIPRVGGLPHCSKTPSQRSWVLAIPLKLTRGRPDLRSLLFSAPRCRQRSVVGPHRFGWLTELVSGAQGWITSEKIGRCSAYSRNRHILRHLGHVQASNPSRNSEMPRDASLHIVQHISHGMP